MEITFEELVSREIDTLYQGAVFLEAGDEDAAEELVMITLTRAFRIHRRSVPGGDPTRWLEGRLALEFRARAVPGRGEAVDAEPQPVPVDAVANAPFQEASVAALCRGAGRMPPPARVAVWLVLFQRWSYEEAARLLGLDREELTDLLRYRHILVAEALRSNHAVDGAAEASN